MKHVIALMLSFSIFVLIIPNTFAESVPEWVKNTAGWWATDQISETEFVNAVEFLVKENIIQVNVSQTSETSDGVPDWVKNTAGWWATDQISETEFVNAIKFLIESGLINISSYNCDQSEDRDRNGVPDIIEKSPVLTGLDEIQQSKVADTFKSITKEIKEETKAAGKLTEAMQNVRDRERDTITRWNYLV